MTADSRESTPEVVTPGLILANKPFDGSKLGCNVVLETSDHISFYVHTYILAFSSSFFQAMFGLPQEQGVIASGAKLNAQETDGEGRPIINVADSSRAVDLLLRYAYPDVEDPELTTISEYIEVLRIMDKYDFVQLNRVVTRLCSSAVIEKEPHRAYIAACSLCLDGLKRKAARWCLRIPPVDWPKIPELKEMSGWDYHLLLDYYRRCGEVASGTADYWKWVVPTGTTLAWGWYSHLNHRCNKVEVSFVKDTLPGRTFYVKESFDKMMKAAKVVLKDAPHAGKVTIPSFFEPYVVGGAVECPACRPRALVDMVGFMERFRAQIETSLDQVELDT